MIINNLILLFHLLENYRFYRERKPYNNETSILYSDVHFVRNCKMLKSNTSGISSGKEFDVMLLTNTYLSRTQYQEKKKYSLFLFRFYLELVKYVIIIFKYYDIL